VLVITFLKIRDNEEIGILFIPALMSEMIIVKIVGFFNIIKSSNCKFIRFSVELRII